MKQIQFTEDFRGYSRGDVVDVTDENRPDCERQVARGRAVDPDAASTITDEVDTTETSPPVE